LLQIVKTEESLQAWKKRNRASTLSVKQLEHAHILSFNKICLPERPRKHYGGSNCGDTLTDVVIPKAEQVWSLTWKDKKKLFGKKHLIAVGGKTETDGSNMKDNKRTDSTVEPVVFNPMPKEFYGTLVTDFYAKHVFDLSTLDEVFAYECLILGVGYVGICYTKDHILLLEARLRQRIASDMADPNSPLYNPAYALAVGATAKKEPAKSLKVKGKPKKGAPKKKATLAKKPKGGKDDGDDDDDGSDLFSGEDDDDDDDDDDDATWDPLK
jgi:hypothetical protein